MNLKDVIFGNSAAAVHDLGGSYSGSSQEWLPIKDILKGVIITRDKRFVKVLELLPVSTHFQKRNRATQSPISPPI